MFELEFLYEQVKNQYNLYNTMVKAHSITESAYDLIGMEKSIDESFNIIDEAASNQKVKFIDKLRLRFSKAEKMLSQYKDDALKVNPVGLQYKDFMVLMSESDIKKLRDKAVKYLNSFDPSKASEEQLKQYITDSKNNVQYKKMSAIFGNGKEKFRIEDIIITDKKDKELTKSDVSNAIKFIEGYNSLINKYKEVAKTTNDEYTEYVRKNGIITVKTNKSIDGLRKSAFGHRRALVAIADSTYLRMLYLKYGFEIDQAKKIMVKAANYNPRNIKESAPLQDYIDSLYEFYDMTEDN